MSEAAAEALRAAEAAATGQIAGVMARWLAEYWPASVQPFARAMAAELGPRRLAELTEVLLGLQLAPPPERPGPPPDTRPGFIPGRNT
jgi:hypothetical protein